MPFRPTDSFEQEATDVTFHPGARSLDRLNQPGGMFAHAAGRVASGREPPR